MDGCRIIQADAAYTEQIDTAQSVRYRRHLRAKFSTPFHRIVRCSSNAVNIVIVDVWDLENTLLVATSSSP